MFPDRDACGDSCVSTCPCKTVNQSPEFIAEGDVQLPLRNLVVVSCDVEVAVVRLQGTPC